MSRYLLKYLLTSFFGKVGRKDLSYWVVVEKLHIAALETPENMAWDQMG